MDQNNELPETKETYWRWGLASLVLGCITLTAMALSYFLVEPRILNRYEAIVTGVQGSGLESDSVGGTSTHAIQWFARMRKAELAAERLMVRAPLDARFRRMHAEVALEIDRTGKRILANIPKDSSEEIQRCSELVIGSRNRAMESIRSATRLVGPDATWAKVWILHNDLLILKRACRDNRMQLTSMIDRVDQLASSLDPADHEGILGVLDIQYAHRAFPYLVIAEREDRLKSGIARLESSLGKSIPNTASTPTGLIAKAWLVEGLAGVDPKRAVQVAREAIVDHSQVMQRMSDQWPSDVKIQAIDAFFRCLLVVSGIDEASATVLTRIEEILPEDQQMLRHIIVASELRTLVSKFVFPEGAFGGLSSGAILRSMLRFGSDHPEVRETLNQYYAGDQALTPDCLVELLGVETQTTRDTFLLVLDWTKRMIDRRGGPGQGPSESMPIGSERDLEGLVGLLAYWIQETSVRSVPWEDLSTICEAFNKAFPNSLDLQIGTAVLAMRNQKWDLAIGYLERIGPSSSNRGLIESLLQEAKKQSTLENQKQ